MRELTLEECGIVAGALYQNSDYQESYVDPQGGGYVPPSTPEPVASPNSNAPWATTMSALEAFFSNLDRVAQHGGSDQNSYYDHGYDVAPMPPGFMADFLWMPHLRSMPEFNYFDYLTQNIDPEFLVEEWNSGYFGYSSSGNQIALGAIGHDQFSFSVNGSQVIGTWHAGSATTTDPDSTIVVSGGHWTFTALAVGPVLDPGPTGAPQSYSDWQQYERQVDLHVDVLARQIEAMIKNKPDWNEREYGAVIYMVNGQIKIGPLTRGMTVAEAAAAGLAAPETRFSTPSDLGNGLILAIVHSHPDVGYNNADDISNRYPSYWNDPAHGPGGDYYMSDRLAGSDPRFGNSAVFAHYILGPDGVLREYNINEGHIDQYNDTRPGSRGDLSEDRPGV